jgi:5-methylcytosine-specific restriction protein B
LPKATNYKISEQADAALQAMIAGEESSGALASLIAEWKETTGYPTKRDETKKAQREELAAVLTDDNLEKVALDPEQFKLLKFTRLAGSAYGGAGNQSTVQRYVNEGPEAKERVALAMGHLLYDDDREVSGRLDDVILKEDWHPTGFGEALSTKSLAVLFPDRWLPLYQREGP